MTAAKVPASTWAVLALLFNALVWGLTWWPFRQLEARGLHPLWATVVVYALTVLALTLWRPGAWRTLATTPSLWILVLAAGTTNAAFNSAVTLGDVVRVVLLFYLMPAWAVLLARVFLAAPIGAAALSRVALAMAGAAVVLWPTTGSGWPVPRSTAEWLGLLGGASFALNNVMLRREAHRPPHARALAMFAGGAVVALGAALVLGSRGLVPPPALSVAWLPGALALAAVFLVGNLALQYGAARLRPDVTAIVLVTEVVFASASAVLLGAGTLTPALLLGGGLIVAASVLAARTPQA